MSSQRSPEQIRRDIEYTRADMDDTLDEIETRVSPSKIRERQTQRVRDRFTSLRTSVMGSPDDDVTYRTAAYSGSPDDDRFDSDGGSGRAQQAQQAVKEAPQQVEQRTRGNPLAAGAIAFGVGALLGSLLPASEPEQKAAQRLREEAEEPLKDEAKQAGKRTADDLKSTARDAALQTGSAAADAARETKDEAQQRAQSVKERGQEGAQRTSETR